MNKRIHGECAVKSGVDEEHIEHVILKNSHVICQLVEGDRNSDRDHKKRYRAKQGLDLRLDVARIVEKCRDHYH